MKTKSFFYFVTIFILLFSITASAKNTTTTTLVSKIQQTIEQNTHTMTLQYTKPSKVGDKYSWLITSEAGQLAPSLTLFTLSAPNSKVFGQDTEVILVEDAIDLYKICEEFHIDGKTRNNLITQNIPIAINYYYNSNAKNAYPVVLFPHYDMIFASQKPFLCAIHATKILAEKS